MNFDFVRNFLIRLDEDNKHDQRVEAASVFALFWNLIRSYGPRDVVEDFEGFITSLGIFRMDPGIHGGGPERQYTIPINGINIVFDDADMAPPQGVFGRNYARHVHFERHPHLFAAAWTTFRNPKAKGCNFYNSSYAIRIQSSCNYACFWQPQHWHGTSLPNVQYSETGGPLIQSGLSLVTSNRLPNAFQSFVNGTMGEAAMEEHCSGGEIYDHT
ncbi:hypothetical protein BT96DRAFT_844479 [Gymnopus androsaceus JB14]|uniref:Uncharacterized protein n=1 Tax=Gymnopus androsaceus JB14 TaxID=1447944 RepID=A0A6A4GCA1_9AGAR|nr:hypothetical protein BT96DRAFT_844479 [Gymnopus androsaceus JB14]